MKKRLLTILVMIIMLIAIIAIGKYQENLEAGADSDEIEELETFVEEESEVKKAVIAGSGDILCHMSLVRGAKIEDGYDFEPVFEDIKPLISRVDLALGDFEGTISPGKALSGFPRFNAPREVAVAMKNTGYDVVDLAQNHILDTGLEGAFSTKSIFEDIGMDTIGVMDNPEEAVLIKDVNGIKVAIIGLSYGYNGMEDRIPKEKYEAHMEDFNLEKAEKKIREAEDLADITVVMPHGGCEYRLEPTEKQKKFYKDMVEWGADIIFGGHPHVPEPVEIVEKDGEEKFILYSMGNLVSNQRKETLRKVKNSEWTERGVIMEVAIEKKDDKTVITALTPHPTWVQKTPKSKNSAEFRVLLAEEYMPGGVKEGILGEKEELRVRETYIEVMELLNINSGLLKPAA